MVRPAAMAKAVALAAMAVLASITAAWPRLAARLVWPGQVVRPARQVVVVARARVPQVRSSLTQAMVRRVALALPAARARMEGMAPLRQSERRACIPTSKAYLAVAMAGVPAAAVVVAVVRARAETVAMAAVVVAVDPRQLPFSILFWMVGTVVLVASVGAAQAAAPVAAAAMVRQAVAAGACWNCVSPAG